MAWHLVPLENHPDQLFSIAIEVDGENLYFALRVRYNDQAFLWHLDVNDGRTGAPILCNIPLVPGERPAANILRQFGYLGLGSVIVLRLTDRTLLDWPTLTDLSTDWVLAWGDTNE